MIGFSEFETFRSNRVVETSAAMRSVISDTEEARKYSVKKQEYHVRALKSAQDKKKAGQDAVEEHKVAVAHKKQAQYYTELAKTPGAAQKNHKDLADEYEKKYLASNYKANQYDNTYKDKEKHELLMDNMSERCLAKQRDFERKADSKKPGYVYYGQRSIYHPGIMQWTGSQKHSRDEGRSDSLTILQRIKMIKRDHRFSGDETNQEMYEMLVVTARSHDADFFVRLLYYTDWKIFGPSKTRAVINEVMYNKFVSGIKLLLENSAEVLLDNSSIQDLKRNSGPIIR
jgi:hypothetical protein